MIRKTSGRFGLPHACGGKSQLRLISQRVPSIGSPSFAFQSYTFDMAPILQKSGYRQTFIFWTLRSSRYRLRWLCHCSRNIWRIRYIILLSWHTILLNIWQGKSKSSTFSASWCFGYWSLLEWSSVLFYFEYFTSYLWIIINLLTKLIISFQKKKRKNHEKINSINLHYKYP